jgi:hypothetical protein
VRPPAIGRPHGDTDVSGIYRSAHGGALQLRTSGEFLLVAGSVGAMDGRFTLLDGRFEVRSDGCVDPGRYDLRVTGEQEPGKAVLVFGSLGDDCTDRSRLLTGERWVYANS